MALINKLMPVQLENVSEHPEVDCTYAVVSDAAGSRYLQIDTYDSKSRQILGKKSQSLRFSPEAIEQLKQIISESGL